MQSNLYKTTVILFTVCCIVALYMKNSFGLLHALLHKIPNPIHYHGKDADHSHIRACTFKAPSPHNAHESQYGHTSQDFGAHEYHELHDHSLKEIENGSVHVYRQEVCRHNSGKKQVEIEAHENSHEHAFLDHFGLSEAHENDQEKNSKETHQKLDWISLAMVAQNIRPRFNCPSEILFFTPHDLRPGYLTRSTPPPELQQA